MDKIRAGGIFLVIRGPGRSIMSNFHNPNILHSIIDTRKIMTAETQLKKMLVRLTQMEGPGQCQRLWSWIEEQSIEQKCMLARTH